MKTTTSFLWILVFSSFHWLSYLLVAALGGVTKPVLPKDYKLITWNILAPPFASPQKYHFCDPAHLDWNFRRRAILDKLPVASADLICLQEVERDTWEEDFLSHLEPYGYTGVMQNVTRGHPIGCAVFVRNTSFRVLRVESRSRALIVVLEEVNHGLDNIHTNNNTLFLANVHLEAGMDQDEKRFCQVHSLLKRLRQQVLMSASQVSVPNPPDPCILIAGDFNMLHSNPVHRLLSTGTWLPEQVQPTRSKAVAGSKRTAVTLPSAKPDSKTRRSEQKFPFLPMRELYQTSSSRNTMGMTFAGGSVLDYIWVSESSRWKHATPWVVDEDVLHCRSRRAWPSADHPSDHAMIGAYFSFRENVGLG